MSARSESQVVFTWRELNSSLITMNGKTLMVVHVFVKGEIIQYFKAFGKSYLKHAITKGRYAQVSNAYQEPSRCRGFCFSSKTFVVKGYAVGSNKRWNEIGWCHPLELKTKKCKYSNGTNNTLKEGVFAKVLIHETRYRDCYLEIKEEKKTCEKDWMVFCPHFASETKDKYKLSERTYKDKQW